MHLCICVYDTYLQHIYTHKNTSHPPRIRVLKVASVVQRKNPRRGQLHSVLPYANDILAPPGATAFHNSVWKGHSGDPGVGSK